MWAALVNLHSCLLPSPLHIYSPCFTQDSDPYRFITQWLLPMGSTDKRGKVGAERLGYRPHFLPVHEFHFRQRVQPFMFTGDLLHGASSHGAWVTLSSLWPFFQVRFCGNRLCYYACRRFAGVCSWGHCLGWGSEGCRTAQSCRDSPASGLDLYSSTSTRLWMWLPPRNSISLVRKLLLVEDKSQRWIWLLAVGHQHSPSWSSVLEGNQGGAALVPSKPRAPKASS